jgi:hypothetical protein
MTVQMSVAASGATSRDHHILRKLRAHLRYGPKHLFLSFAGRFHGVRRVMQWLARRRRPVELAGSAFSACLTHAVSADVDPGSAVQTLQEDGVLTGVRLQETALTALRGALLDQPCYGSGNLNYPFVYPDKPDAERRYGKSFLQGHYYGLTKLRAVRQLAADTFLDSVVSGYFRAAPQLIGVRAWWTFACEASTQERLKAAQLFHYDLDDYLELSVFFYLTDVDVAAGPHVFVPGTHGKKSLRHVWTPSRSFTDDEIENAYGADRARTICGRAGDGFIEDSFCFHKGQSPTTRDRLILQLRYAVHDYGTGLDEAHRDLLAADSA